MTAIQKEIARLRRENAAMRRAQGVAQPTVQYTRKAGPVTPVPTFIARRAMNHMTNHTLANALRRERKPTSGATWEAAKKLLTLGFAPREAARIVVVC